VQDPTLKLITGSKALDLAIKHASRTKKALKSKKFKALYGKSYIQLDKDNEKIYTTKAGGERICCSVGSSIVGNHAHIHIMDDANDPTDNDTQLLKVNRWAATTLSTRKVDPELVPLINIQQRVAEGDFSGYLIHKSETGGEPVRHICLPADDRYEIKPIRYKKYYRNGLLNPVRLGRGAISTQEGGMPATDFAAQYGQSPTSVQGNIMKREYVYVASRFELPHEIWQVASKYWADMAYTEKEDNDPSGVLETKTYQGVLYIFDFVKFRKEFDAAVELVKEWLFGKDDLYNEFNVENKASGLSIASHLRTTHQMNAVDYTHRGRDKEASFRLTLKYYKAQRVVFVKGPYMDNFLKALYGFPKLKHDEEPDTISMAITQELVEPEANGTRQVRAFRSV